MKRSTLIYITYLIFILSITAFLSIQILKGEIKMLQELERGVNPVRELTGKTENKLIQHLIHFRESQKLCEEETGNSLGFLDDEWQIKKPPNTYRIMALGDSFTGDFCIEERYAWPNQLEEKLNALNLHLEFEVLNMGRGGSGTYEEVEILKKLGLNYTPDTIVLQYFYNDFQSPEVEVEAGDLWEKYKKGEYKLPPEVEEAIKEMNVSESALSRLFYDIIFDKYYPTYPTADLEEEWNKWVKEPVIELTGICKNRGIQLIVIIIPDLSSGREGQNDKLISLLHEYNISFYDFSDHLSKFPISSVVRYDGHLTALGYEIVANRTLDILIEGFE